MTHVHCYQVYDIKHHMRHALGLRCESIRILLCIRVSNPYQMSAKSVINYRADDLPCPAHAVDATPKKIWVGPLIHFGQTKVRHFTPMNCVNLRVLYAYITSILTCLYVKAPSACVCVHAPSLAVSSHALLFCLGGMEGGVRVLANYPRHSSYCQTADKEWSKGWNARLKE